LVTVLYSKYGEDLAYLYSIVEVLKYIFWGRPCRVVLDCQNPEIIKLELVDPSFDIIKYFRKICQLLVVGSVYSVGMAIWLGALEHVCFKDEAMYVFCNDSHLGALRCLSL
jgi:hypothetical protein